MNTEMQLPVKMSTISTQFTTRFSYLFSCKICVTAFSRRCFWFPTTLHIQMSKPELLAHGCHVLKVCIEERFQLCLQTCLQNQQTNHNFWYCINSLVGFRIEFKRSQCKMYTWLCLFFNNVTSAVPHMTLNLWKCTTFLLSKNASH